MCKMSIRHSISDIRKSQANINILRADLHTNFATLDFLNPRSTAYAVLDSIEDRIFWNKENMNVCKDMLKVRTIENNLLKQEISSATFLKDLRTCCYGIQNNIF